ncbi:MAG: DUF5319 family protein [Actinobacteria bacterium]|nr:DUF5319 family protein [Actinomycetota bacterium]
MSDDDDFEDYDEFGDDPDELDMGAPLDEHESALVRQDLVDLESFESTFVAEGYRGVSVFCQDCVEEHFYPWDMLRGNLELLLETGETPVHEPAFAPDPDEYVPWEYARGYIDALRDTGVDERLDVSACPRCGLRIPEELGQANFCPRCGAPLLAARLAAALRERDVDDDEVDTILRQIGIPR